MKILKILGSIFAILVLATSLAPTFLPNHSHIERSIEIQASPSKTFSFLSDLKNYRKWDPFSEMEPQSKFDVQGTGIGSIFSWKGNETGEGKMTITRLEQNALIHLKLDFIQPMQSQAEIQWRIESTQNSSKVTWVMDENLPYFQRFFGLFMDKMLGASFEKGLQNLKKQLELNS